MPLRKYRTSSRPTKSKKKSKKVKRTKRLRKPNKRITHKKIRRRRRRNRTKRGGDDYDDESGYSSYDDLSRRSSFSSLGDFETEDLDDIRDIMDLIHTRIFFKYDTEYSDTLLYRLINNLDTYDLYRRIEYIRDATDKIIPDSDGGVERKNNILLLLDVLLEDTIPNTRTPTPVTRA